MIPGIQIGGGFVPDPQAAWQHFWRQRDLVVASSVPGLMSRGYIARGAEWALRGSEILALKVLIARQLRGAR